MRLQVFISLLVPLLGFMYGYTGYKSLIAFSTVYAVYWWLKPRHIIKVRLKFLAFILISMLQI